MHHAAHCAWCRGMLRSALEGALKYLNGPGPALNDEAHGHPVMIPGLNPLRRKRRIKGR